MPTDIAIGRTAGLFWPAGANPEEHAVPGTIDLTGRRPRIEVAGELTPALLVASQTQTTTSLVPNYYDDSVVVHGTLPGAGGVTVLDCTTRYRRTTYYGLHLTEHHVEGSYALVGRAQPESAEHTFDKATFQLHHLGDWAQGAPLLFESQNEQTSSTATLSKAGIETVVISLPDLDAELTISSKIRVRDSTFTSAAVVVETQLEWDVPGGQTLRDIIERVVGPLVRLMTILFNEDCPALNLQVRDPGEKEWLEVYGPVRGTAPAVTKATPLLTLAQLNPVVIANWLQGYDDLSPVPQLVAGAITAGTRTIENQVLELATAAEGLHRRLYREAVKYSADETTQAVEFLQALASHDLADAAPALLSAWRAEHAPDDRPIEHALPPTIAADLASALDTYLAEPSFPMRLRALLDDIELAAPEVAGKRNRWVSAVVNARVAGAHSLRQRTTPTRAQETFVLVQSLRWVLTARLLLHVGVADDVLAAAIEGSERYRSFLSMARTHAPKIYASA